MADAKNMAPTVVEFPISGVYRIARKTSLLKIPSLIPSKEFSKISIADQNSEQGNRFDLESEGVLYCATEITGCFMEVLAKFRVNEYLNKNIRKNDLENLVAPGGIPASWREKRQIWKVKCERPLYFLDLSSPETYAYLDSALGNKFLEAGLSENLDVSIVRGTNRRVTRIIANWAAEARDADGNYLYSGIRHFSRRGEYECWSIFEQSGPILETIDGIAKESAEIRYVANAYGLTIF